MRLFLIYALPLFLGCNQISPKADVFEQCIVRANMTFKAPEGYIEVSPIENEQMNWDKGFKHPSMRFEVRYKVWPLDSLLFDFYESEKHKKPGDININPNKWHKTVFEVTLLNISGGILPEYTEFDSLAVAQEFNADWGATATVEVGEEFGQKYQYCLFVMIHKDDLGNGYIFYLADEKETISEEMFPIFHALTFQ